MLEPFRSRNAEAFAMLFELRTIQPALGMLVARFMRTFVTRDPAAVISAALTPLLREEGDLIDHRHRVNDRVVSEIWNEYFGSDERMRNARGNLNDLFSARSETADSLRMKTAGIMLWRSFSGDKRCPDRDIARTLFFVLWECEIRSLRAAGIQPRSEG